MVVIRDSLARFPVLRDLTVLGRSIVADYWISLFWLVYYRKNKVLALLDAIGEQIHAKASDLCRPGSSEEKKLNQLFWLN